MGVERMKCCGALTSVYGDAGKRRHNPGCKYLTEEECPECGGMKWLVLTPPNYIPRRCPNPIHGTGKSTPKEER